MTDKERTQARLDRSEGARAAKRTLSTPRGLHERVGSVYASSSPFMALVLTPLRELQAAPWPAKILAVAGGAIAWVFSLAFVAFLPLAVAASLVDFYLGRYRAKTESDEDGQPRFHADIAQIGYAVKVSTYAQLSIMWGVEVWAWAHLLPLLGTVAPAFASTLDPIVSGGWIATGLLVGYWITEMDSIEAHKLALGKGPLPMWWRVSGLLRYIMDRTGGVVEQALGHKPDAPGYVTAEELEELERERRGNAPGGAKSPHWGTGTNGPNN